MKFTESHEWIEFSESNGIATVGVSEYAQNELGDIVYVELPEIGKEVQSGKEAAVLESTKAAADVYSPVSGKIVEVNLKLKSEADLINRSPQKDGWIFKLKVSNPKELDSLMDQKKYLAQFQS